MSDTLSALTSSLQATSALEYVSVVFGLAYVLLAARENGWCWPAAMLNTATAIALFWDATLLMESALNVFYLCIAFYGAWQWKYGGTNGSQRHISTWPLKNHLIVIALVLMLSATSGYLLQANSSASFPYLDSFTSWSAVFCTWMVTRKILENWLFWILINSVSMYLFYSKGLAVYAMLMAVYLLIAVYGYRQWSNSLALANASSAAQETPEQ